VHLLFPTDTDHIKSLLESNRSTRSRTSSLCAKTEQSNMTRTILILIQTFIYYFEQTLITLNLFDNRIGDQGAAHLVHALQQNKVT